MAKKGSAATPVAGGGEHPNGSPQQTPIVSAADVLGDFAADLGSLLGGVQSRAASWLGQRKDIAAQLTQIRDTASQYLQQLAGGEQVTTPSMVAKEVARRGGVPRRGRLPGSGARRMPAPKEDTTQEFARPKRTMSSEARERIAEAQRRRWAKHRKAAKAADR